jgi:glycogen debranching enzyme
MALAAEDEEILPGANPEPGRQPHLHRMVIALSSPAVALSPADGQVGEPGTGFVLADRRLLSRLVVTVDGLAPDAVAGHPVGAAGARFVGVVRHLGDPGPDPTVLLERDRVVSPAGVREVVTVVSRAREAVTCTVGVDLDCDLADIAEIKLGLPTVPLPALRLRHSARWRSGDGTTVLATLAPPAHRLTVDDRLEWTVTVSPRQSWSLTLEVTMPEDPLPAVVAAPTAAAWEPVEVTAGDARLPALVRQSLADLGGLVSADPEAPADSFLAAGAPWYFTVFGRDSLWAARMALPLGTGLAAGTLRALARRQGRRVDPDTGEEPGKILHEVRRVGPTGPGADVHYGTVDATPLWISLLHDAWRWGLPEAEVAGLLPHLDRALDWLRRAVADGAGFVRYRHRFGQGPANQGWKDSHDSVQFADGRLAAPPIALCEVQGYAHAAARQAADLLDAFGRPGGDSWRGWAGELRDRFRAHFWVTDPGGPYPAIAVDESGRPVDTVTSNIGHLLGTGLLDAAESELVVRRLAGPDMDCGFGLRTMSARATGFNPLSYHGGSVWAHDTAIAVQGLTQVGGAAARDAAASLVRGLLTAAHAFAYRLPELYGGESAVGGRPPLAYPAACRPQAWSAAASLVLVSAVLGLAPDVPAGRLRLRPLRPSPVGELTVRGLRVAGHPLDADLTADGQVKVLDAPSWLRIDAD